MNYESFLSSEYILSLLLKMNPEIISRLTGYDFEKIKLEENFYKRKIDVTSQLEYKKIFIESQLNRSDKIHLEQILYIIKNVKKNNDSVIVWIANSFNQKHIDIIKKKIKCNEKNIEFVAVEIKENMIEKIKKMKKNFNTFEIIDNLNILYLDYDKNLNVIFKTKHINKNVKIKKNISSGENSKKLTDKEMIMEEINTKLVSQLYYIPNIHRERIKGNIISIGSGISDAYFCIGINREMEIFIELKFGKHRIDIYNSIYKDREKIERELKYEIEFDSKFLKLYSKRKYYIQEESIIIKEQIDKLERLIIFFQTIKKYNKEEI